MRDEGRVGAFRALVASLLILLFSPLTPHPSPLLAQDQTQKLRQQREELDKIRQEREDLERRAATLQSTVHDLGEEVSNLDRRADATSRMLKTLDAQLLTITEEVSTASGKMQRAEGDLVVKRNALRTRLVDIYKRGPLFTSQAMLSARSFGELVARYKYLHLLALHDRTLVTRVQQLRDQISVERDRLVTLQTALEQNRADKQQEEARLRTLERERATDLRQARDRARQTEDRLARLKQAEAQLTSAIAALEAARKRAETARPNAPKSSSTISTGDYGKLDWPVEGPLIYNFGKAQAANNTTIRWNGVGIRASVGTPVRSVAPGRVASVRQLGTYGLMVIVDHGGGDYSIYGSLARSDVREQEMVAKGQSLGTVGISDPDLPPHLHFEIRHDGPAVDPATWLRTKR